MSEKCTYNTQPTAHSGCLSPWVYMASWELRLHDATSMTSVPYHATLTQEEVSMINAKNDCY